LTPNELDLTFGVRNYGAKFHQNRVRIATVGEATDRQTDRQTDHTDAGVGDLQLSLHSLTVHSCVCWICYSNGTDSLIKLARFYG